MRLDADLLRWFRQQRGYQTRINAILRAHMQANESVRIFRAPITVETALLKPKGLNVPLPATNTPRKSEVYSM